VGRDRRSEAIVRGRFLGFLLVLMQSSRYRPFRQALGHRLDNSSGRLSDDLQPSQKHLRRGIVEQEVVRTVVSDTEVTARV